MRVTLLDAAWALWSMSVFFFHFFIFDFYFHHLFFHFHHFMRSKNVKTTPHRSSCCFVYKGHNGERWKIEVFRAVQHLTKVQNGNK